MKLALYSVGLVLAVALIPIAAVARDIPEGGLTIDDVVAWLKAGVYKAQIQSTASGRIILSSADGTDFHIRLYDCVKERCSSVQFFVGLDTKGALSPEKMNAWNHENRWARAYVDKVNDPWLEFDVDLSPGGSYELLDDEFQIWRVLMRKFQATVRSPSVGSPGVAPSSTSPSSAVTANAGSYGAIAYAEKNNNAYVITGAASEEKAKSVALAQCQKENSACTVPLPFSNSCGALARASNTAWGTGWGNTQAVATNWAISVCQKNGGNDCKLKVAACSPGGASSIPK